MSSPTPGAGQDPDLPYVQALQEGQSTALNRIMDKYREPLFRFVYRHVQNEEDAGDILQETFVRVYFKITQFRPKARFVTWLYQIATNLCRDHARKARRKPSIQEFPNVKAKKDERAIENFSENGSNSQSLYQEKEEMALLDRAIQKLPHDLKTALIFVALEGKSYAESAACLKITEKAVETRVYRAKKILEQNLKEHFDQKQILPGYMQSQS